MDPNSLQQPTVTPNVPPLPEQVDPPFPIGSDIKASVPQTITTTLTPIIQSQVNSVAGGDKKHFPIFAIIFILVLVTLLGIVAYILGTKYLKPEPIQVACTKEAKICPDGSSVGRSGPNCEFTACPVFIPISTIIPSVSPTESPMVSPVESPSSSPEATPSATPIASP